MAARGRSRPTAAVPPTRSFRLAGLGTAVVGAALVVGSAFFYLRDVEREKALVPAQGTVIEQRERSHGTETRVVVTVRFTTAAGQTVRFERTYGERETPRPAKGETLTVLYDPERPTRAEIQDSGRIGLALVAAVGAGFLGMGIASLTWTFRHRGRTNG
jgi:hypothetical protein